MRELKQLKVSIGCDHAAYNLKEKVKQYLTQKNIEVNDFGCYSEERCDYPDFAHVVANDVTNQNCDFGILICGSGNGINMTANKWSGIRSALCWNAEIANMARLHNDANILTLPGRYISDEEAYLCVDEFIQTEFEDNLYQSVYHQRRYEDYQRTIRKISYREPY